jgi:hypothetical protein
LRLKGLGGQNVAAVLVKACLNALSLFVFINSVDPVGLASPAIWVALVLLLRLYCSPESVE